MRRDNTHITQLITSISEIFI